MAGKHSQYPTRHVWSPGIAALNSRMKEDVALKIVLVSAALALSGLSAQGQSGTISGFVRDSTNGESLSYVDVFVPQSGLGRLPIVTATT